MHVKFTFNDLRNVLGQMRKRGPIQHIIQMSPRTSGISAMLDQGWDPDADLERIDGIINSMTPQERQSPEILGSSRRRRIANGSGCEVTEIDLLVQDLDQMANLLKFRGGN